MTQSTVPQKVITITKREKSTLADKLWYFIPSIILVGLLVILIYRAPSDITFDTIKEGINEQFFIYLIIGVLAQMVDGTLGMGYGATCTSFLLVNGVPPVISSTAIHIAEMFTTGTSTIANHKFGNINKKLAYYLIVPGVIGSILGATILSNFIDQDKIRPFVAIYMIILASIILRKGLRSNKNNKKQKTKKLGYLALFGGFMDSVGGGGWGPIVTSTLVGRGRNPIYTIASVNAAEFTIAFASGITFLLFQGINAWQVISGLVIGGIIAAPFAAFLLPKIPRKGATIAVSVLIFILSIKTLSQYL